MKLFLFFTVLPFIASASNHCRLRESEGYKCIPKNECDLKSLVDVIDLRQSSSEMNCDQENHVCCPPDANLDVETKPRKNEDCQGNSFCEYWERKGQLLENINSFLSKLLERLTKDK